MPREIEEIGVAEEEAGEILDCAVALQNLFDFVRQARDFLHEILRSDGRELASNLPKMQRREQKRGKLAGESFVDARQFQGPRACRCAVGFAREHGAHTLHMASTFAPFWRASRSAASVSAVSPDWLMQSRAVLIDDGIAIPVFAAVIHLDWKMGEALDHEFSTSPACQLVPAGNRFLRREILEFGLGDVHFIQEDVTGLLRNAAEQRVTNARGCSKSPSA